jgi:hypothetical protein
MDDQPDDSVLLKPKPKRIKTPAQQAVWDKACALRIANAKLKKDALANAKTEIENKKKGGAPMVAPPVVVDVPEIKQKAKPESPAAPLAKKKPKIVYESESESEPEVIVVKKKKKKQQIVYEEGSSEDEAPPPPKRSSTVRHPAVVIAPPVKIPVVRFF